MKRDRSTRGLLFIAILSLNFSLIPSSLAGVTTGTISGRIVDAETGEPLSGVQIAVDGIRRWNLTDNDGHFFIPGIPPGLHDITARVLGYRAATVENQRVFSGHTHKLDFSLESAVIELPVLMILGDRHPFVPDDLFYTEGRAVSEEIRAMPVDSYRDIVTLQAGVVRYGDALDPACPLSVRGGRVTDNIVYVDGIDVRRYQTGQNLLDVPEFGIEEITIKTGRCGSRHGGARSGVIDVITKNGGSDLSGSLRYETEELNPSSWNYGYNSLQFHLGGPVPWVDDLAYFFSTDLVGKGDRRPRASGFRGTTEDLFDVAERYSNQEEVRDFLGTDLDILEMLKTARCLNPDLPILNLSDFRRKRFGGTDFEGRLPGNQGDEYRISGKLAYQLSDGIRLTGTYLEDRDQGLLFNMGRIFSTEERNQAYVERDRIGIFGYDHILKRSPRRSFRLSFRGSYHRFEGHQGDLFAPNDTTRVSALGFTPGASLGYHDQQKVGNFMFRDIPIFGEDFWPLTWRELNVFSDPGYYSYSREADNPFGIQGPFHDSDNTLDGLVVNGREDRANIRIDLEAFLNRSHRIAAGVELKTWQLNRCYQELYHSGWADYWEVRPDMESVYLEDRLKIDDLQIDLGLRLDTFNPATDYDIPAGCGGGTCWPEKNVVATRKTALSPGFSVSHPVSERIHVRGNYAIQHQLPPFYTLYNYALRELQWYERVEIGNPDLDFTKAKSFEFGVTALLSYDWVLDIAAFRSVLKNSIAARYRPVGYYDYQRVYQNDDSGIANGLDFNLKKRFSDYFALDLAYSLLFSKSTGSYPEDWIRNEGYWRTGDEPPSPPDSLFPNDFDQAHTIDAQVHLSFPDDYRKETLAGTILRNTGFYLTLQAHSGRPFTHQDPVELELIEEKNSSRTGWQTLVNLRVTKDFSIWGLGYTAFADIRNLLDADNLSAYRTDRYFWYPGIKNGTYQTTGSPYANGQTIRDAIDYLNGTTPEDYVDPSQRTPTDIDGDGDRDEADRAEIIRRLDMNRDGTVTIEEELAMWILAHGSFDANPENFDIPRLFRLGLEVRF